MPNNIDNVIKKFIEQLSILLGNRLKKAILYGSYARGDYDKNSDIDIMVLTDFDEEEIIEYRKRIRDLACDLEMENDVIISPLLRNINKFEKRVDVIPFYTNIQKEGVVLHGWWNYNK